jgi:hypothetical protein
MSLSDVLEGVKPNPPKRVRSSDSGRPKTMLRRVRDPKEYNKWMDQTTQRVFVTCMPMTDFVLLDMTLHQRVIDCRRLEQTACLHLHLDVRCLFFMSYFWGEYIKKDEVVYTNNIYGTIITYDSQTFSRKR